MIGREHELGLLSAFLDCSADGPTAFVLEGEPGIGKSTLWLAGVEFARQRGMLVLSSRPAEAERGLAHVGLGDLFDDVVDDVVRELPMPRRRALEVALLREAATNDPVDQRALGVASRDVLHLLSEQKPTLLAIDDVQWLDASSSSALALALRRLAASRVLLLFARRLVDGAQPSAVEQALEAARVLRLQVGPLSLGALHRFLRERVDRTFARQTLLRIHEQSGGNPFYALELARALGARVDPSRPLPLPETLDELLRRRVSGLPANTRDALAVAAAAGTPSESLLERAGVTPDALRPALDAGVITRQDWTIRFTHPLLASVVYDPSVHARLAQVVDEPLARARHLALAQAVPNAGVARELDDAAALAMERGAAAVSAELAENALRLTPADERDVRRRRALAAARAHKAAGEWTRAQAIAKRTCWRRPSRARTAPRCSYSSPISRSMSAPCRCSSKRRRKPIPGCGCGSGS